MRRLSTFRKSFGRILSESFREERRKLSERLLERKRRFNRKVREKDFDLSKFNLKIGNLGGRDGGVVQDSRFKRPLCGCFQASRVFCEWARVETEGSVQEAMQPG